MGGLGCGCDDCGDCCKDGRGDGCSAACDESGKRDERCDDPDWDVDGSAVSVRMASPRLVAASREACVETIPEPSDPNDVGWSGVMARTDGISGIGGTRGACGADGTAEVDGRADPEGVGTVADAGLAGAGGTTD